VNYRQEGRVNDNSFQAGQSAPRGKDVTEIMRGALITDRVGKAGKGEFNDSDTSQ
jgi:hypothetical protein